MPLSQLLAVMTVDELQIWAAYFDLINEDSKKPKRNR
jgi:hypothetical protein